MIWPVKFDKKFIFSPTKEIELRNVHITYTGKLLILAKVKNVFFSRYFPPNDNSFCFHARKVYTNYKFHSLYLEWSSSKKETNALCLSSCGMCKNYSSNDICIVLWFSMCQYSMFEFMQSMIVCSIYFYALFGCFFYYYYYHLSC